MNLMFWKKKSGTANDAEGAEGGSSAKKKAQEPTDFATPEQEASEASTDSPEQESPAKIGLVARIKSKFASLTRHFSKAPAFQAEEHTEDAQDKQEGEPDTAAQDTDPETPAKPGLVVQIKSGFAALSARFRKTPKSDAEEAKEESGKEAKEADQGKDASQGSEGDSKGTDEGQVKPGLVERIKAMFATLALRFKKVPASDAGKDQEKGTKPSSKKASKDTEEASEEPGKLSGFFSHYANYLIAVLILLLLAVIVYSAWDIIFPPLVRKPTPHYTPEPVVQEVASQVQEVASQVQEVASQVQETIPQSGVATPQVEAEVLKKKSEEARARAEALKKESEEAQAQAEALRKESEAAQARAEELMKKQEEEKARAEALKKKNEEEKAKAEALKKAARQTGRDAAPITYSGEVAVGSSSPQANVQSLKEAIELMNRESDGQAGKKGR